MTAPTPTAAPGAALSPLARLLQLTTAQRGALAENSTLALSAQLYAGDLWAAGRGWSGPRPAADSTRNAQDTARVSAEIERTFVSRNLARDIIDRHATGVIGREPLIGVLYRDDRTPTQADATRLSEYDTALTDWAEASHAHLAAQRAVTTALTTGQGTVRLYVHRSNLDTLTDANGQPALGIRAGLSLSEAARRVSVHAPNWDQAGAVRDREGHVQGAWYTWTDEQGQTHTELHQHDTQGGVRRTLIHPDVRADGTSGTFDRIDTPDLWIYELRLDPLLTDSVRRLQLAANKTLTMGSRNIDLGGFVERTILNAQMPGQWKTDPDAPGGQRFVPATFNVGAGSTQFLSGVAIMERDPHGQMRPTGQFSTPQVIYKDPTPFDVFADTFEQLREAILDEANQLHILISGDASASGVSRQQAVNDFMSSLEPTRIAIEALLRWMYDAVLRFALQVTGRIAEADAVRIRAQARLSAVQPTPAEIKTTLELHQAGLLSRETTYSRLGVEDGDAEVSRLAAEAVTPTLALRLLETAPAWVGLRALSLAFPALQITEEDIQAQRDLDLAPPTAPADLNPDPLADPDPADPNADPDA